MFGRVKNCFVLSVALLAISCVQDKKDNFSDTEDASGLLSAAALRVAIYYVGDVKCRAHLEAKGHDEQYIEKVLLANNNAKYLEAGKNTHRLDGDRAELSSKEYVASLAKDQQANTQLSGDKFLKNNSIARTLATLKDNCRRLLLSVDSEVLPSLSSQNLYHTSGNFAADSDAADNFWPARFAADFGDFGGKITCASDQLNSLCGYAEIKAGKRYFVYLYPKPGEDSLAATVTYTRDGEEQTETITIADIALSALQHPTTKLRDIVVHTDCGEDNSCLFADNDEDSYTLECNVEGEACGSGFAFKVEKAKCGIRNNDCPSKKLTPVQGKLCAGTATVAALGQDEINLVCKFSMPDGDVELSSNIVQIKAHHLAGKLCVVTKTTTASGGMTVFDRLDIKSGACGKVGKDGKELRLELSFALDK